MSGLFSLSRAVARPAVRSSRALPLWVTAQMSPSDGPRLVFLPAYGDHGAAHLRIYQIATALRGLGWQCFVLPWRFTLKQRRYWLARLSADLVVMQGSRHALNRPDYYPDQRIIYDIDDADFQLDHLNEPVTQAIGQVVGVIAGSAYIARWCRDAGARQVDVIWTGAPLSAPPLPQEGRPPVVAWAQTRPMTYRREAALVARVMANVAARVPGVTLRLFDRLAGDDPDFADRFAVSGLNVEWIRSAKYSQFLGRLDDVAVGLAPLCPKTPFSRGKGFGKVLGYLDRGVPVIGSAAGEHMAFFTKETGLISNTPELWVEQVVNWLADPAEREHTARAARQAYQARLSLAAVAQQTDRVLRGLIATDRVKSFG